MPDDDDDGGDDDDDEDCPKCPSLRRRPPNKSPIFFLVREYFSLLICLALERGEKERRKKIHTRELLNHRGLVGSESSML